MPVYTEPQHAQEIVKRCPNHTLQQGQDQNDATFQIVKLEHTLAEYVEDPVSGKIGWLVEQFVLNF